MRSGAEVAELNGMTGLAGYPDGARIIGRRKRATSGNDTSSTTHTSGVTASV